MWHDNAVLAALEREVASSIMQSTRPVTRPHASDSVSMDSLACTSRLSCCLFPGISHQGGVPNQALWHWFRSEQWTMIYSTQYYLSLMHTCIQLKTETRDRLKELGRKGESYDTIINRILDERDNSGVRSSRL